MSHIAEHIAYCRARGMTAKSVAASVGNTTPRPSWAQVARILELAMLKAWREADLRARQPRAAVLFDTSQTPA